MLTVLGLLLFFLWVSNQLSSIQPMLLFLQAFLTCIFKMPTLWHLPQHFPPPAYFPSLLVKSGAIELLPYTRGSQSPTWCSGWQAPHLLVRRWMGQTHVPIMPVSHTVPAPACVILGPPRNRCHDRGNLLGESPVMRRELGKKERAIRLQYSSELKRREEEEGREVQMDGFEVLREIQQGCCQTLEPELPLRLPGGCLSVLPHSVCQSWAAADPKTKVLVQTQWWVSELGIWVPLLVTLWAVGDMRHTSDSSHTHTHTESHSGQRNIQESFSFYFLLSFKYQFHLSKKHKTKFF